MAALASSYPKTIRTLLQTQLSNSCEIQTVQKRWVLARAPTSKRPTLYTNCTPISLSYTMQHLESFSGLRVTPISAVLSSMIPHERHFLITFPALNDHERKL